MHGLIFIGLIPSMNTDMRNKRECEAVEMTCVENENGYPTSESVTQTLKGRVANRG